MSLIKNINKKTLFIITLFLILFTSCASSSASKAYCDKTVNCLTGYECIKNKCEKLESQCSLENKYGFCKEEGKDCYDGICKTLKESKCDNINCSNNGICDLDAENHTICICTGGYHPVGLKCLKDGVKLCGDIECINTEHCENNKCSENTKLVQCDRDISIPENGEIIISQFKINWTNNKWEEIKKCDWTCKQGYKKDDSGESCIIELDKCSIEHPTGVCEQENYICLNGECTPPPTMGSMCQTQSQCPSDMICILNGIENGYCTKRCTDDSICGNYKCGDFLTKKYCLKPCNNILDCRSDFTCNNDRLCRPKCLSDSECKEYQICDNSSGLCINQDLNCDIFNSEACSNTAKSCYPFNEIGYTACAQTGILENGKMCNKDNICIKGSICTTVTGLNGKRCETACKPSNGIVNNPSCNSYNKCINIDNWNDLGYCKYDSSLKPIGLECSSDIDCDYQNGTCMVFENYNICVASNCPQQGAVDSNNYPNKVMCVGMNVNGSWNMYWMDTCEIDSDCYSSHFTCYENPSYPYPEKYCRPSY